MTNYYSSKRKFHALNELLNLFELTHWLVAGSGSSTLLMPRTTIGHDFEQVLDVSTPSCSWDPAFDSRSRGRLS